MADADISITGMRGCYEIKSLTEEGAAWMWSNIPEAKSVGGGAVVAYIYSAIYAREIFNDAREEGLDVGICLL